MLRALLAAVLAASLSACAAIPALLGSAVGSIAPAPVTVANQTTLDEKGAIALETLYTTFARTGALAFRTGIVTPSPNPAVQRDDFCPRVLRHEIEPTDRGMEVMALECRLRAARDAGRAAYDAGNAASYQQAFSLGLAAFNEGMALTRRD